MLYHPVCCIYDGVYFQGSNEELMAVVVILSLVIGAILGQLKKR